MKMEEERIEAEKRRVMMPTLHGSQLLLLLKFFHYPVFVVSPNLPPCCFRWKKKRSSLVWCLKPLEHSKWSGKVEKESRYLEGKADMNAVYEVRIVSPVWWNKICLIFQCDGSRSCRHYQSTTRKVLHWLHYLLYSIYPNLTSILCLLIPPHGFAMDREVDKRLVELPEIRETGEYIAEIKLHPEVTARVRVNVFAN